MGMRRTALTRTKPPEIMGLIGGHDTSGTNLYKTYDGSTWQSASSINSSTTIIDLLEWVPLNGGFWIASGAGNNATVWTSVNGEAWTARDLSSTGFTSEPSKIAWTSTHLFVASSYGQIAKSSDGGATWADVNHGLSTGSSSVGIYAMTVDDSDRLIAGGGTLNSSVAGKIRRSGDSAGGGTWSSFTAPSAGSFTKSSGLFADTPNNRLLWTNYNGSAYWTSLSSPGSWVPVNATGFGNVQRVNGQFKPGSSNGIWASSNFRSEFFYTDDGSSYQSNSPHTPSQADVAWSPVLSKWVTSTAYWVGSYYEIAFRTASSPSGPWTYISLVANDVDFNPYSIAFRA